MGKPVPTISFSKTRLRGKWGFQGYVVSRLRWRFAISSAAITTSQPRPRSSAISLQSGMDNECIDFRAKVTDDHDYKPYIDAVKQGYREGE